MGSMSIAGSGGTVRIIGRGVREVDRQLLYSAAWLDDPLPVAEPKVELRRLDTVSQPRPPSRARHRRP